MDDVIDTSLNNGDSMPHSAKSSALAQREHPQHLQKSISATQTKPIRLEQRINPKIRATLQESDLFWRLNLSLQKSLDIEQQIKVLFREFRSLFNIDHCHYAYPSENISCTFGEKMRHTCTYTLVTEGEYIGEITLSRQLRFSEEELVAIEHATLSTIYPLRNGLKYHQAVQSALTDSLTGVGNRISLDTTLQRELDSAHRYQHPLSLVILDVDHFKTVNDQYGHSAGDAILRQIAQTLMKNSRCADMVFRFGGEEFVIILNKTDSEGALIITERLRIMISGMQGHYKGQTIPVTISAGLSSIHPKDTAKSLLERADKALYTAKNQGRNQVIYA